MTNGDSSDRCNIARPFWPDLVCIAEWREETDHGKRELNGSVETYPLFKS